MIGGLPDSSEMYETVRIQARSAHNMLPTSIFMDRKSQGRFFAVEKLVSLLWQNGYTLGDQETITIYL